MREEVAILRSNLFGVKEGGAPRVFISYSHDSPGHVAEILALANKLRAEGIDCDLDQYYSSPPEGWPAWTANQIQVAWRVLVVCTETYLERLNGKALPGVGRGATWEGALITQEFYEAQGRNDKYIPLIVSSADQLHIPSFLRSATFYDLAIPTGYVDLYRRLSNQPSVVKPPLGDVTQLEASAPHFTVAPDNLGAGSLEWRSNVVGLMSPDGFMFFSRSSVEELEGKTIVRVAAETDADRAWLEGVSDAREPQVGRRFCEHSVSRQGDGRGAAVGE
jgi:SEFIR domain